MIRKIGLGLLAVLVLGAALWLQHTHQAGEQTALQAKLDQIVRVTHEPVLDCAQIAAQNPMVILALGQSNAANHGELSNAPQTPVTLIADGKCIMAADPLPGSTGNGGSIWSRLPHNLLAPGLQRPLVLSVMGVDATSIADWTSDKSLMQKRLTAHIKSMNAFSLSPHVVLWQQGEADARLGISGEAYGASLGKLANILTDAGSDAPILLALSTVCRSLPSGDIRTAITSMAAQNSRFKVGPDTDTLNDARSRFDGCHFSAMGLDHAARLWANELQFVFASI